MLKILSKKEKEIIGVIWFFHSTPYVSGLEIGFNFFSNLKKHRELISDAVKCFCSYLFSTYNIPRIKFNSVIDNDTLGTQILLKKTGFVYEGTMREAIYIRGKLLPLHLFSLLKDECFNISELMSKEG